MLRVNDSKVSVMLQKHKDYIILSYIILGKQIIHANLISENE